MKIGTTWSKLIYSTLLVLLAVLCIFFIINHKKRKIEQRRAVIISDCHNLLEKIMSHPVVPVKFTQKLLNAQEQFVTLKTNMGAAKADTEQTEFDKLAIKLFKQSDNTLKAESRDAKIDLLAFIAECDRIVSGINIDDVPYFKAHKINQYENIFTLRDRLIEISTMADVIVEKVASIRLSNAFLDRMAAMNCEEIKIYIPPEVTIPDGPDTLLCGIVPSNRGMIYFSTSHKNIISEIKQNRTYTGLFIPSEFPISMTKGYPAYMSVRLDGTMDSIQKNCDVFEMIDQINEKWGRLSCYVTKFKPIDGGFDFGCINNVNTQAILSELSKKQSFSCGIVYNLPSNGKAVFVIRTEAGASTSDDEYIVIGINGEIEKRFTAWTSTLIMLPGDIMINKYIMTVCGPPRISRIEFK